MVLTPGEELKHGKNAPTTRVCYVAPHGEARSGVARYANRFGCALEASADVWWLNPAPDERLPGSLRVLARSWRGLRRELRSGVDVVWVEVSGNALTALYLAALVVRSGRTRVYLTVHDAPALTGNPVGFSFLRGRRLRHIAWRLLHRAGDYVERFVLQRATGVFALSQTGATALNDRWSPERAVRVLRYAVAPSATPGTKAASPQLFLPGPVGHEVLEHLLAVVDDLVNWSIEVGFVEAGTTHLVDQLASVLGPERVRKVGLLDQADLTVSFERAWLVMRLYDPQAVAHGWAAVSGIVCECRAAGSVLLTNHPRGSREYASGAATVIVETGVAAERDALRTLLARPTALLDDGLEAWRSAASDSIAEVARFVRPLLTVAPDIAMSSEPLQRVRA